MIGEEVVRLVREYIGTPFHFGGRVKGVGVDCGGLVVCVLRDLSIQIEEPCGVTWEQGPEIINLLAERYCERVDDLEPGDVIVFAGRALPAHCGLYSGEGTFIHAWDSRSVRAVVETPLDERWTRRLVGIYRVKEGFNPLHSSLSSQPRLPERRD